MIRKTKVERKIAIIILLILGFIGLYDVGINLKRIADYSISVDKENILQYVEFVGPVSDMNRDWIEKVLQEQVSDEAINYIVNSGGKLRIVYCEDKDITDYFNETYNMNVIQTVGYWDGVTVPYSDPLGNLCWTDVVVQCHDMGIGELAHELGHVYDLSHGTLSEQEEFIEKIYNNKEVFSEKVMSQAKKNREHYESNPKEYFAELYKRYCRGDFKKGYNAEMDTVVEYFDSLELKGLAKR